jgi:hypothetical protein
MARCPFAVWDEITGGLGPYSTGPYRIVHHTTEGPTYAGARAAFAARRTDPHFTVDAAAIHQHIDTAETARALRNDPGGSQTNRASAVQIEVVGFAARAKDAATLANVARLCRWIEQEHGVPQAWPNGLPRFSTNGHDPGGHNRNGANWDARGGHYGHSQVPENVHWDPGYTPEEVAVLTPDLQPVAAPKGKAPAVARAAGKAVAVGRRPLVSVLFTGRDATVVRLFDLRGKAGVARELRIDAGSGLAVCHDLIDTQAPRKGRRLLFQATVNGEPALIHRHGPMLLVRERRTRREEARITVVSYETPAASPATCPSD